MIKKTIRALSFFIIFSFFFLFFTALAHPAFAQNCSGCHTDQRCQSCGTYACLVCVAAFPTSTPMPFPTASPTSTDIPTSATTTCNQGAYCPLKTSDYCAPNGASTTGCTNVAVGSCVATPHNGYVQTYQGIYCFCKNNKWQCSSEYTPSCHFLCTLTGSIYSQTIVSTSSFLRQYITKPFVNLF